MAKMFVDRGEGNWAGISLSVTFPLEEFREVKSKEQGQGGESFTSLVLTRMVTFSSS